MDADLNRRLDYELLLLEHQKKEYVSCFEQTGECNGVYMRRTKHKNSEYYYYIKHPGETSYGYIGRSSQPEVVRLRNARFLKEAIKRIDHNIELVKALKQDYLPLDLNRINEGLSDVYRCESLPASDMYTDISTGWLAQSLEFQKKLPENYPQYKKHRTSDGIMVKTISEVLIYERLKAAGLAVIYELPFAPLDHGPIVYPDFAVLSPVDMESVIFIEFAGRMDQPKYREDFAKKVGRYIDSGYVPGVNLFFIFSDKDGNIDSLQITKVIADIIGLRNPDPS